MGLKEDYQAKLEAQLKEWSRKIDQLKSAAEKVAADARVTYHQQIDALRGKQEAAQKKLQELRESGEGAWESLKAGIDRAWDELKQGVEGALSRFKGEADREEEIRLIAYRIWEEEGRPHGRDWEHWRKAEAIWQKQQGQELSGAEPRKITQPKSRRRVSGKKTKRKSPRENL